MKNSKLWTITALIGLTSAMSAMQTHSADPTTSVKSSIAKDMLYGQVERRGYSWSSPAVQKASGSSSVSTKARARLDQADWGTSKATLDPQHYETVTTAEQSSYKWGIRSTADQSSYKWGIRSTADQSSYKWGIRSTADQSSYKWGIRSTADQSSYKWGIRSTADQSSYKWGIRSTADQSSYKWGIR
jgi:hypothetical protein